MIPNDFCSLDQKGHQSGCSIMDCFPHARVLCNLESVIVLQAHFFFCMLPLLEQALMMLEYIENIS